MAIEIISTIKPKNNGNFPIVEAKDITVDKNGTRLDDKLKSAIYAVKTADEMDEILTNATENDVGDFYMYIGETTDKYENGIVYKIETN